MRSERSGQQKHPLRKESFPGSGERVSTKSALVNALILLLILILNDGTSGLIQNAKNVASISGQRVTLECKTGRSNVHLKWSSVNGEIYNGYNLNHDISGYEVSTPRGQVNLGFVASKSTALLYTCVESSESSDDRQLVEVVVLDYQPSCLRQPIGRNAVSETFICQTVYYGNWRPTLAWDYKRTGDMLKDSISNGNDGNRLKSTLAIEFNAARYERFTAICYTKFNNGDYHGMATGEFASGSIRNCSAELDLNKLGMPTYERSTTAKPMSTSNMLAVASISLGALSVAFGIAGLVAYKIKARQGARNASTNDDASESDETKTAFNRKQMDP